MTNFTTFNLPDFILNGLTKANILTPTPVQEQAIPPGLSGQDILASASTGTGKTLAFLIPILTKLIDAPESTALILTPTRELAIQIEKAMHIFWGSDRKQKPPLRAALLIGGDSMVRQYDMLRRRPHIIVGTPGRVHDHLRQGTLNLSNTKFLVLDETDRMLDMGFSEDLEAITSHLPEIRQTFMFSATLPSNIEALSRKFLRDPQRITVGEVSRPSVNITQESIKTKGHDKFSNLLQVLEQREGSVIVFVKTKMQAEALADRLRGHEHRADAIHGDLRQRKREQVIWAFRNSKSRVLVATDVAARGLDIPHLKNVVNYDLPQSPEDYIHRIGRTGRAGASGFAISFISPDENRKWTSIQRLIQGELPHAPEDHLHGPVRKQTKPFRGASRRPVNAARPINGPRGRHTHDHPHREKSHTYEESHNHDARPRRERDGYQEDFHNHDARPPRRERDGYQDAGARSKFETKRPTTFRSKDSSSKPGQHKSGGRFGDSKGYGRGSSEGYGRGNSEGYGRGNSGRPARSQGKSRY